MGRPKDKISLRALREKAGKTQREVALALNVGERIYVRWEHGDNLPDAENLVRLADFFGVHPRLLIPDAEPLVAPGAGR